MGMMTNLTSMVGVSDEVEEDGAKVVGNKTKNKFHTTPVATHMDECKKVLSIPKRSRAGKINEEKEYSSSFTPL